MAARTLLAECLSHPNDMIVFLLTRSPSELRRFALNIVCENKAVYDALAHPDKAFMLAKLIYNSNN